MNGYSTLPVIQKIIFLSFSTHLTSLQIPYSYLKVFQQIYRANVWSEQEEGFERPAAAAMVKKISVTNKALIPGLIKPSRMSKGITGGSKRVAHCLLAWRERPWIWHIK
ncbi:hypothetical protein E1A91_A06G109600v1 [Gossypium mustelinum]|uniref:Uncharacterized protein n=1 Tax=Gossypium mustelinum TaxID=34275 RepID=A0A5D2YW73_GOSMU|nr:hypothetical protein E1A91_A06G109600v1 [Gossypium mustelinum]